jgi:hypothetical protein
MTEGSPKFHRDIQSGGVWKRWCSRCYYKPRDVDGWTHVGTTYATCPECSTEQVRAAALWNSYLGRPAS